MAKDTRVVRTFSMTPQLLKQIKKEAELMNRSFVKHVEFILQQHFNKIGEK